VLVDCHFSEVFFGGARGGGKTDGVLGKWALKERRRGQSDGRASGQHRRREEEGAGTQHRGSATC